MFTCVPDSQKRLCDGGPGRSCISLRLFVLVTMRIVTDAFDDQAVGKGLPHPSTFHLKCNDAISLHNLITILSQSHHRVPRTYASNVNDRATLIIQPSANHSLGFIAAELLTSHLNRRHTDSIITCTLFTLLFIAILVQVVRSEKRIPTRTRITRRPEFPFQDLKIAGDISLQQLPCLFCPQTSPALPVFPRLVPGASSPARTDRQAFSSSHAAVSRR